MSYKKEAFDILSSKNITPEYLFSELQNKPNKIIMYKDVDDYVWSFVVRRRCHLYLMAKNQYMDKYEIISSKDSF
jgi:hypothetical protein